MTLGHAPRAIVVDASVMVEVIRGDESRLRLAQGWAQEEALLLAPLHFRAEVANALLRSARLPANEVSLAAGELDRSGVEPADRGLTGLQDAIDLADRHGLTVYDALYLQLAIDVDGELATLDKELRRAAEAEQVALTL
jgi:predicted nucleic acid-binding protein